MTPQQAKESVKHLLRGDSALRGVGITWSKGRPCVLVNVAVGADRVVRDRIRTNLPDVEFVVQEVGDITTE
ncbi:MAG: hypothetical protein K2P78_11645 [Gemmataceae bacterium]|nr:hypothetical protein [Gemmataceae bacterium]